MRIGAASSRPAGVFPLGIWGANRDVGGNLKMPEGVGEGIAGSAGGVSPGIKIKSSL